MKYEEIAIGEDKFWIAQPETLQELAYTLNEEPVFMLYDPNNIPRADSSLVDMFNQ